MKKFIAVFILLIMALVIAGCGEAGSEAQAENQPVVLEYKDIDPETIQLLESYMQKINLILELGWNDTNLGEVRFEADEFKRVLEILYEYKTGQLFPQKNSMADVQSYIDISSQYFNFDEGYLRRVLSAYMYDFATDSVYTAGNIDTSAVLNIKDICQKDDIYEITYSRKYETYNEDKDSYSYTSISKGVLTVRLDNNGDCKFISNKLETSEYKKITDNLMRYYIRPRLYAMTDMLNYSWDEEGKGSLYFDTNAQVIQYTVEKLYELYTSEKFPHGQSGGELNKYIDLANKYFDFDRDFLKSQLDYISTLTGNMPLSYYTPTGNFVVLKSVESTEDGYNIKYLNGIRSFDNHIGSYQLLDCVESTLVLKLNNGKLKAVANKNAYYDVQDTARYRDYLSLLNPALEYNLDNTADNPLTNSPDIMKCVLQNIILNDNLLTNHSAEDKFRITEYRYAAEKMFCFGSAGFEHMLKKDSTYDSDLQVFSAANNTDNTVVATVVGVDYQKDCIIVKYLKNGRNGCLYIKKDADGNEKVEKNIYGRLTLQELEQINEYYRNTPRWQYVLEKLFESPEKINITNVFRSMPTESWLTYDCYYEVHMRKKNGVELDYDRLERGLEEYGRVSAQSVDSVLKETMNISLSQVENPYVDYSPEYSCYYKSKEYSAYPSCQFIDGYIVGDTVLVYDDYWCLTLKKTDDKYYIYSFTRNEETHTTDMYAENGISTEIQLFTRDVYLEQEPGKSAVYNNAIKAYNDFLLGKLEVEDYKCKPEEWLEVFKGWNMPLGSYGLFDMNHDGIPELITSVPYWYDIYSYKSGAITKWGNVFNNGMNGPNRIFPDGTAGTGHISTGAWYDFYRFNADGSSTNIMSFDWYEPQNHFKFNGRMVTKEEFERLTDPWLDKFDNPADIDMKSYLLEKEYWEIYADKLA